MAAKKTTGAYTARDLAVLEGLDAVRKRPGMYIGGIDERALHHLAAEIMDNAMDEAVAGHASRIHIHLAEDQTVTITACLAIGLLAGQPRTPGRDRPTAVGVAPGQRRPRTGDRADMSKPDGRGATQRSTRRLEVEQLMVTDQ